VAVVRWWRRGAAVAGAAARSQKEEIMVRRLLPLFLVAAVLTFFVSAPVLAADPADRFETHEGKVVSVSGNKLVMATNGKEHTHIFAPQGKVMLDGKTATLHDLRPGMRIRVTTPKNDMRMATKIEALDKNKEFAKPLPQREKP
jgi:hypothetical protein